MPTIQKEILKEFLDRLKQSDGFNDAMVNQLRDLFEADRKPKAKELVNVFSAASEQKLP